jgi:uncharacterized protein (DUF2147 family)
MKKLLTVTALVLVYAGAVFASDPVEGFWLSVDHRGRVESGWEMSQNDGILIGKVLSGVGVAETDIARRCRESYPDFPVVGKVNQLPVLGTPWIFGLDMESPGHWAGGHVVDASNGSIYRCSLIHRPADGNKFKQETLEIRGQLLFFSGSQYWRRATREEAVSLR